MADENPFGTSQNEEYNALDKAWRSVVHYDRLHPQEKSDWDNKLSLIEGSSVSLEALHKFIKENFKGTKLNSIYSRADRFVELARSQKKKRQTKESKKQEEYFKQKEVEYKKQKEPYRPSQEALKIAEEKFSKPDLILEIHQEIDKDHKQDHKEKLTTFLTEATAYLEPEELHKSQAVKGDSSTGKDNNIKKTLQHFPPTDWIFLTNATQSVMEDNIDQYKIIAYSEMNTHIEDGANTHLREVIKQMAEGGTSSLKKDLQSGFKETKFIKQKQKTVIYGTTGTEDDEELGTRFVIISIQGDPNKTDIVNDSTMDWFSGKRESKKDSWIAAGISTFKHNKVIIPFAEFLKDKIDGSKVYDNADPRSMRDVKRLMAYVCAIAWLYQKQREIKDGYIIAELFDFLLAVEVCGGFFDQTYKGLGDARLQQVVDIVDKYFKDNEADFEIPRKFISDEIGRCKNTVKKRLKGVIELNLLEFSRKDGNQIYYKRGQKGVKKGLLRVNIDRLKSYLVEEKEVKITKEQCDILLCVSELMREIEEDIHTQKNITTLPEEIDTLKLTPCVEEEVK